MPNSTVAIRCSSCGYETTVDRLHNPQSDLSDRRVGGTHVCDRFEYGKFVKVIKLKRKVK